MSQLIVDNKCAVCGLVIEDGEEIYGIKPGTVTDTASYMFESDCVDGIRKYKKVDLNCPKGTTRILWSRTKKSTRICHKDCIKTLLERRHAETGSRAQ
jgi:hypothetical protein